MIEEKMETSHSKAPTLLETELYHQVRSILTTQRLRDQDFHKFSSIINKQLNLTASIDQVFSEIFLSHFTKKNPQKAGKQTQRSKQTEKQKNGIKKYKTNSRNCNSNKSNTYGKHKQIHKLTHNPKQVILCSIFYQEDIIWLLLR